MSYSIIQDQEALNSALSLCKGNYQRNIVLGHEALSGATLRGKAKKYGGRYAESRRNLMRRLMAAGIGREQVGSHNKRVLVIGQQTS